MRPLLLALVLLSPFCCPSQTLRHHAAAESNDALPTGRWLSSSISRGGIGSWWDFRPDGTLSMFLGPAVTAHVTHNATTVNVPSGLADGSTIALDYRITGNILNLKRPGEPDTLFTREGPAPRPSDPLLGRWRPNPPATYSPNPQLAARQKAMTLGVYVFHPDNTQTVRIPFLSRDGTWDAASHTFRLEGDAHTYSFQRSGQTLTLGQPPDNARMQTYVPDTLFPQ